MRKTWATAILILLAAPPDRAGAEEPSPVPYVVSVDYTVDDGNVAILRALVSDVAKASIAEPGCRRFDVVLPVTEPGHILLFEVFDDLAAFKAHADTPHFKRFAAETARISATRVATPGAFMLSLHNP